jgi:hypothetical protein
LVVAFQVSPDGEDCVFYFATEHSSSSAGEMLARSIASVTGGRVEGRASALLRDTSAPAVVVSQAKLDDELGLAVVDGINLFFANAAATR